YKSHFPESGFLGFAVQRSYQHVGGIEFSVGITRDALFGPLVVCGAAGAQINVMTDRQIALPPLNMVLARELLRRTYMYKLLKEHSLKPEEDIRAVSETLVTLSQIVIDIPEIKGLEISPLLFNEQGAVAVNIAINLADKPGRPIIQPYPRELEEWIVLPKSGRRVIIRPVLAEDEPAHRAFHELQSPESIRYRFFQYRKHFSREDVAQMVQIDYDREMVFIANAPREDGEGEETLGTVRTWTDADNLQCEFAVMVHDKMKGEGLGVALMQKMIDYCRARGTVEMVGNVLPDNRPMLQLAEHLGFEIKFNTEEEVMDLRLVLNEPEKDWQRERLGKSAH
ncbi:MAG TPA: GNAT family N-acetyltransferase, partial [Marinobacter adhaerens]|nr:GNAT family N-acetyltransferase [Marinobacter adhaerens]